MRKPLRKYSKKKNLENMRSKVRKIREPVQEVLYMGRAIRARKSSTNCSRKVPRTKAVTLKGLETVTQNTPHERHSWELY